MLATCLLFVAAWGRGTRAHRAVLTYAFSGLASMASLNCPAKELAALNHRKIIPIRTAAKYYTTTKTHRTSKKQCKCMKSPCCRWKRRSVRTGVAAAKLPTAKMRIC